MGQLGRSLSAALALAVAIACGSSSNPTSPDSPAAPNPLSEGATWSIFFTVDSCTSDRPFECSTAVGRLVEMTLKTAPVAGALSAVLTSRTNLIADLPVLLSGQMQPDGSARYAGSYISESPSKSLQEIDVSELVVKPDDRSGLSGALTVTQRRSDETRTVKATVLSASRQPFPDTPRLFQGDFEGFGTLQLCDGICPDRLPGQRITISLRLTHSGSTVTGEFGAIQVSGVASGTTLTLTGERRAPLGADGLGTTLSRVESLTAAIDVLGRLTGTLRLYNEGVYDSQPGAITRHTPFTELLVVNLTTVIRQ